MKSIRRDIRAALEHDPAARNAWQVVFVYPWAAAMGQLKLFGLVEMAVFFLIVIVGFVYAWKKGVLEWK